MLLSTTFASTYDVAAIRNARMSRLTKARTPTTGSTYLNALFSMHEYGKDTV